MTSQKFTVPRARMRRLGALAALVAIASLATGCPAVKAGTRCTGNGWGRDSSHVLQCRSKRWTRVMTIADYLNLLARIEADKARNAPTTPPAGVEARAWVMRGTSGWVDVYDWSPTWVAFKNAGAKPGFTLSQIDRMADNGIDSLYIQTAKADIADDVLDRDLLNSIIAKARARGMRVIGWYLPTFGDIAVDLRHLQATAALGVDGVGVDIEDRSTVADTATRNARLIDLSAQFRTANPALPIAAIVLPPVVTEVINTAYWPQFPWQQLAGRYDVWMPMGYWTNRKADSGWRDGYRYTAENIDRIRANTGLPNAAVHPIGGLSDTATAAEIDGFVQASLDRSAIGGGLYDNSISANAQYIPLARLRK
jgi:hypothetical protein